MAFLSDLISGPGGLPFDNDDLLEAVDDEDLKNDPVSQMDMKVGEGSAPAEVTNAADDLLSDPPSVVLQGLRSTEHEQLFRRGGSTFARRDPGRAAGCQLLVSAL